MTWSVLVSTEGSLYLNERHPHSILLDVLFDGVTNSDDKLMRDDKYQDVSSFHRFSQVWNGHLSQTAAYYST